MNISAFGLTAEQTEILLNMEYYKTLYDIQNAKALMKNADKKRLKQEWLDEWKRDIVNGFGGFLQIKDAELHWYSENVLLKKIKECNPEDVWYRMVLLEATLFEPYHPLSLDKGKNQPSTKYSGLNRYKQNDGDRYLDMTFAGICYPVGYIQRLRNGFKKAVSELKESASSISLIPRMENTEVIVDLICSDFPELNGDALIGSCLAYLGTGLISAGREASSAAYIGGGSIFQYGAIAFENIGERTVALLSAKLIAAIGEIHLKDERNLPFAEYILDEYGRLTDAVEKRLSGSKSQTVTKTITTMKAAKKSLVMRVSSFDY